MFSNVGHWIEGGIITAAGITLMRAAVTGEEDHDDHAARLLTAAGSLLGLGLVGASFHHGGPRTFFGIDRQQRQHLQMAALITGAGASRRAGRLGALVSGAAMGLIGRMFLAHEQHGTSEAAARARAAHQRLGRTIVAGSVLDAVGRLVAHRPLRGLGALGIVAAGVQLLTYKEPPGAFATPGHGPGH